MKKQRIQLSLLSVILLIVVLLTGCGSTSKKVVIGLNGIESRAWEHVKEAAKKEGIEVELKFFADYVQPNRALVEGDLQLNAFQTVSFLEAFNQENGNSIVPIGTTQIAPMGIYSNKIKQLSEVTAKAKVTIPNDVSNQGRALKLLEEAKLIELKKEATQYATLDDIIANPLQLDITPIAAPQLPPTLDDVQFAVINNGIAVSAGFMLSDALFKEPSTATPYINVIAAKTADKDNATYQKIVELYQTEAVKQIILDEFKGNMIPTFVPLSQIGY